MEQQLETWKETQNITRGSTFAIVSADTHSSAEATSIIVIVFQLDQKQSLV